jgi:hydroxymethylglutaryl-CoA reductase (NADPH)
MNLMSGRGKSVIADVILPEELVKDRLKTTPEAFVEVNTRKNLLGGIISGSIGYNAQAANVFKALFKATGQDLGHVVEGSLGITWAEKRGNDLYLSVTLPCVNVGIVGGGTRVETAQECLKILNVKSANEFAEVVAAAVLAGELSLISAQSAHHLARAHKKMGR